MQLTGKIWLAMFLAAVFMAGVAQAGSDYRCTIGRVSLAQGDTGHIYDLYKQKYVGKEFSIERVSGLMAGVLNNSFGTKPQVIDAGSKNNSYKVISTMRSGAGADSASGIYALTVLEYKKSSKKPFVYLHNDMVFFGECEHF
jgi:hypothetical protein